MIKKSITIIYTIFLILLCSISVFAAADKYYQTDGFNTERTNEGFLFGDYDEINLESTTVNFGVSRILNSNVAKVMVGDIDGDSSPELVYDEGDGIHVLQWDQDSGQFGEEYTLTDVDVHSPITLYDGDNDGQDEIYFCGIEDSVGNSSVFAVEVVDAALEIKWQSQVGDGVTGGASLPDMGCGLNAETGTAPANLQGTYNIVCDEVSGTDYCYFVGVRDSGTDSNRRGPRPAVYKYNAETGVESKYEIWSTDFSGDDDCRFAASSAQISHPSVFTTDMYGYAKQAYNVMCDLDSDGVKELYIPMECQNIAATDYNKFILAVNPVTMAPITSFSSNGLKRVTSGASRITSPSCFDVETDSRPERLFISYMSGNDLYMHEYGETGSLIQEETVNVGSGHVRITDMFFGEYNGDDDETEQCVISADPGSNDMIFYCTNIDGLIKDEVQYEVYDITASFSPSIVSTRASDGGVGPSNIAGDLNADVLTHAGLWKSAPDTESFSLATNSYTQDGKAFSVGDFDVDGFTDIVGIDANSIILLKGNTTGFNEQVDLKQVIPDVRGQTMCYGNQSFFISTPTVGYEDVEQNNVRMEYSCENNGTYEQTAFFGYGGNLTVQCPYNNVATHQAKLCMQDNIHPTDRTQCVIIDSVVNNLEGCEDPDGVYDVQDVVLDDNNPTDPDPDSVDTLTEDLTGSIKNIYSFIGVETQSEADLISGVFLLIIFIAIGMSPIAHSWIVGLTALIFSLAIMSFQTFDNGVSMIRPIYLVVMIILALVYLFFFKGMAGNNGGEM